MVKDTNKEKNGFTYSYTLQSYSFFLMKFENLFMSFILSTRTTVASVLKLVNRQDLKSCGW